MKKTKTESEEQLIDRVLEEPTIHEKYHNWIIQSRNGYITGLDWVGVMEILRWCESRTGRNIPMNPNCATCIVDLIKLFDRLKI